MRFSLIIAILLAGQALAQDYYNLDYLVLESNISTRMAVVKDGSSSKIQNIKVMLAFYPRTDSRQEVLRQIIDPEPAVLTDTLLFEWDRPVDSMGVSIDSAVKVNGEPTRVFTKIPFPILELDDGLRQYIQPSETIDSNDQDIRELAAQLASGEDDEAMAVHKLAEWTHKNIDYDLNTITAEATQKASWVLESREGVCDELTNLFIALCRSLGIPARFVSGISYTTSEQFDEPWSPHGWAEVYYPGYGWVSYDVTYGEFGYVNPTHLSLKQSVDSNRSSTRYEWEGYNAKLETSNLVMKTRVIEEGPVSLPDVSIQSRILKKSAGFASHNLVEAEVTNLREYYVSRQVSLSETDEIEILGDRSQFVMLGPKETKTLYWTVKTSDDLDDKYVYTFKIGIYTPKNESSLANFTSSVRDKVYDLQEIRTYYLAQMTGEKKAYSKKVELACEPIKGFYYVDEFAEIKCMIRNTGNVPLDNLSVCLDEDCSMHNLSISESHEGVFHVQGEAGIREIMATVQNTQVSKIDSVQVEFLDKPIIEITELRFPANISVDKPFALEFRLSRKSSSLPENVRVKITGGISKEMYIESMQEDRKFVVNVDSYTIADETFRITVDYEDQLARRYSMKQDFSISMNPQSLTQRAALMLNKMDIMTGVLILVSAVTFVVVTEIILFFRRKHRRY